MSGMVVTFANYISEFLTRERIDLAASTGDPEHETIKTKFKFLDIKDRGWDGEVMPYTIQNSHLNRPLNLDDVTKLLDKIRYAIEIIGGVASISEIPVSYIYTLEKYFIQLCLYMKDRGHIMHVLANLAAIKLDKMGWTKVIDALGDGRGSSRMMRLISQMETTVAKMADDKVISVKDMIGAEMNLRLLELSLSVKVSIESLENHVREMDKINNSSNKWTPHNYGMLELRSLDDFVSPAIAIDEIYMQVLKSDIMQSKQTFLGGRQDTLRQNAGHEDEPLYYFAGAWVVYDGDGENDFEIRWNAYEKVNDVPLRKRLYGALYDNNETTKSLLETLDFMNRVGMCSDWRRLVKHLTKASNAQSSGSTTNLDALTPIQIRSALKYLDLIKVLAKKAKWGSNIPALVKVFVDEAIDMLEIPESGDSLDNNIMFSLKEYSVAAKTRHKHFFIPLYRRVLKKVKGEKPQRSGRAAKTDKLAILSGVLAEVDMPTAFSVMDRVREDHYQITYVDLISGEGFELGHIKAGTSANENNIFLQFKKDNKFNSASDITLNYWRDYMKWATRVYKALGDASTEDMEAYRNTMKFCTTMCEYVEENKELI